MGPCGAIPCGAIHIRPRVAEHSLYGTESLVITGHGVSLSTGTLRRIMMLDPEGIRCEHVGSDVDVPKCVDNFTLIVEEDCSISIGDGDVVVPSRRFDDDVGQ